MSLTHVDSLKEYGTLVVAATSAGYIAANTITWTCPRLHIKSITVKETGGSKTVTLRIRTRVYPDGNQTTQNEGVILASGETTVYFDHWYYEIEIAVKDGSGHAAVEIDYGGRV
jgi:hypothetical protein